MHRPLIAALVLLAQALPPMGPGLPMPPLRAPLMPPAAPAPADGITVGGSGYASAQATTAEITLRVSTRNGALTLDAQSLQPIVDALVRAGADRASVQIPPYLVGAAHTNNAAVTATVHHPTQMMLAQGMLTMAGTFASLRDIILNQADVRLSVDDCAALQRNAAARAMENARQNAQFMAKQIGKHAGRVLAIDGRGMPIGAQGACSSTFGLGPYGPPAPQPADMLTVKVYGSVTMRFAIRR